MYTDFKELKVMQFNFPHESHIILSKFEGAKTQMSSAYIKWFIQWLSIKQPIFHLDS